MGVWKGLLSCEGATGEQSQRLWERDISALQNRALVTANRQLNKQPGHFTPAHATQTREFAAVRRFGQRPHSLSF
jgi:hypothetical protein